MDKDFILDFKDENNLQEIIGLYFRAAKISRKLGYFDKAAALNQIAIDAENGNYIFFNLKTK